MGLTGKYDFRGIKKWGGASLASAFSTIPYVGAAFKIPVIGVFLNGACELFANWLANSGLIVLNVGAIAVEGSFDQKQFDDHMDAAFKKIEIAKGTLTPKQIKEIDDEVIKYFRKFAIITGHN